ncbi:Uma2 family endonuclease [Trichothermofontia sichuanensis]|uniref:Uma2 family endonuclease n=1 Tax=Trichothermofontia sichuanensis TaxID=3045816 RepID=UPI00249F7983
MILSDPTVPEFNPDEIIPSWENSLGIDAVLHNDIASNLLVALKLALKGQPYRIFITDQRLWIPVANLYTYPDVIVVAKPLMLQTGRTDTVTNPVFIAEVLSKATQDYDRGEKFLAYRTLPSFQEYRFFWDFGVSSISSYK